MLFPCVRNLPSERARDPHEVNQEHEVGDRTKYDFFGRLQTGFDDLEADYQAGCFAAQC